MSKLQYAIAVANLLRSRAIEAGTMFDAEVVQVVINVGNNLFSIDITEQELLSSPAELAEAIEAKFLKIN